MKLDILAIGAHPDDVEISMSGTIIKHLRQGYKVGIVDLSQGELGTRGNKETRKEEAKAAAEIMGIHYRNNLEMADGFFEITRDNMMKIIRELRYLKPKVVFANAFRDRHPDHGRGSNLVSRACFLSGLVKIHTDQEPWRPKAVYHYIQDRYIKPDFVVDITAEMDQRMKAVMAYKTQFYDPDSKEPETPISSPEFMEYMRSRFAQFGRAINVSYAEGFNVERTPGVNDVLS